MNLYTKQILHLNKCFQAHNFLLFCLCQSQPQFNGIYYWIRSNNSTQRLVNHPHHLCGNSKNDDQAPISNVLITGVSPKLTVHSDSSSVFLFLFFFLPVDGAPVWTVPKSPSAGEQLKNGGVTPLRSAEPSPALRIRSQSRGAEVGKHLRHTVIIIAPFFPSCSLLLFWPVPVFSLANVKPLGSKFILDKGIKHVIPCQYVSQARCQKWLVIYSIFTLTLWVRPYFD